MALKIERLNSGKHIRSDFCCGQDSLDHYLYKQASQDLKRRVSTVFVLTDEPELTVIAYYTLSAYTADISVLDEAFAKRLPRYPQLPATLLGRLAIDDRQKGKRLGEFMLVDALRRTQNASMQVASLAMIAETLDQSAANFYLKYGFQPFKQHSMKLYFPMKSVEVLCHNIGI
ncbi:MAG: GNAT family N-acetyltransferase [Thermosynechococcaceae cyanobacterium]